ncbi:chromosome partitioning protein [Chryseobacterium defluvii]|uniref:Chromosome partitioning protein n=1 Tax=Chryseobacterium defluvii TaxID=160396 RepID=A0A840KGY7_9FLAO|nr:ParA family protein [Chryseobacterium defluvii]MBB4807268.1 chromosome partitioning protein [Chryseobacterium defluvii]
MIITFANQKGGVGKTTIAIAFANYLSLFTDKKVSVIDFDFQRSFYRRWSEDKEIKGDYLYEVEKISEDNIHLTQNEKVLQQLKTSEEVFLFDTAGNIQNNYTQVLQYSDVIIIPFGYSNVTMMSTVLFLNLLRLIKVNAKLYFIRSNMRKDDNYELKPVMDAEFETIGKVIGGWVFTRKCLLSINTKELTYEQKLAVKETFDELIYHIWEF